MVLINCKLILPDGRLVPIADTRLQDQMQDFIESAWFDWCCGTITALDIIEEWNTATYPQYLAKAFEN